MVTVGRKHEVVTVRARRKSQRDQKYGSLWSRVMEGYLEFHRACFFGCRCHTCKT